MTHPIAGLFLRIVGESSAACRCLVTRDGAAYGSAPRPERGSIPGIGKKRGPTEAEPLCFAWVETRGIRIPLRGIHPLRRLSRLASCAGQPLTRLPQLRAPNGVRSPAPVTKKRPDRSRTSLFCMGGDEGDPDSAPRNPPAAALVAPCELRWTTAHAVASAPRPERGSIPGTGNKKEARPKPDLSVLHGWRRGGSNP